MESGEKVSTRDVLAWQDSQPQGFHGILTNPMGERGFLSKIGGATNWTPIGKGQDDVEVLRAAKNLHNAMSSSCTDSTYLRHLGDTVERLAQPKSEE